MQQRHSIGGFPTVNGEREGTVSQVRIGQRKGVSWPGIRSRMRQMIIGELRLAVES